MRRNRRLKNNILIDLTALLDVIFILLMVVLARQQVSGMNLEKREAELTELQSTLEEERIAERDRFKLYSDQITLAEKTVIISVTAAFDPEKPKHRTLKILKNGNAEPDVFILEGGSTGEQYAAFEKKLDEYVSSAEGLPVILSIADDGSEILYRDQQKIQNVFNGLQEKSDDVYVRAISGKEEE